MRVGLRVEPQDAPLHLELGQEVALFHDKEEAFGHELHRQAQVEGMEDVEVVVVVTDDREEVPWQKGVGIGQRHRLVSITAQTPCLFPSFIMQRLRCGLRRITHLALRFSQVPNGTLAPEIRK